MNNEVNEEMLFQVKQELLEKILVLVEEYKVIFTDLYDNIYPHNKDTTISTDIDLSIIYNIEEIFDNTERELKNTNFEIDRVTIDTQVSFIYSDTVLQILSDRLSRKYNVYIIKDSIQRTNNTVTFNISKINER